MMTCKIFLDEEDGKGRQFTEYVESLGKTTMYQEAQKSSLWLQDSVTVYEWQEVRLES